ncbi:uncharacterized protein LOC113209300 [Frankliniella occidentalis]|uniref:Uncharacterized protein LOC113209300 n=1 Tax=Frankliniella occidentalis TaxID=133901 RepID=A0A9C6XUM8_FRAOC|nr:uncharacterized protein LOC113209300 [Frankliniella occidentalis]
MAQRAFLVLLVVSALGACACQRQYDYQYPPTQYPIYSYTQPPSVPLSVQPYALSPNQKREAQHVQQVQEAQQAQASSHQAQANAQPHSYAPTPSDQAQAYAPQSFAPTPLDQVQAYAQPQSYALPLSDQAQTFAQPRSDQVQPQTQPAKVEQTVQPPSAQVEPYALPPSGQVQAGQPQPAAQPPLNQAQPPAPPPSEMVQPYLLAPSNQHTQQPARQPTYQEMVEAVIARGVTRLAINLAKVVEHDGDVSGQTGNVVFSPLNVATALALVLAGSNGTTFNEIANALGIKVDENLLSNRKFVHEKFGHFLSQLESGSATVNPTSNTTEGSHVVVANGLFVQKEYDIQPSFAEIAASYRSQVIPVDFMNDNTRTKDQINNWFSKHTLGRIKSVLPESPPRETKLMIASALYFNGAWEAPFPIEATMVRPFNGVTVNGSRELSAVRMMTNNMDLPYAADHTLGVRLLELPYKTRDTSMFLLLPDADGLAALREVERRLHEDPGILERLIETRKVAPVIYTLPRMKLQRSISLRTALETLGVHTLFDERHADLSHLSDKVVTRGPLPPPAAAVALPWNFSVVASLASDLASATYNPQLVPTMTELGLCFSFNSLLAYYVSPRYWRLGERTLDNRRGLLEVNVMDGSIFAQLSGLPSGYQVRGAGLLCCPSDPRCEVPDLQSQSLVATEGRFKSVLVTALAIHTSEGVRRLSPEQRRCRFTDEPKEGTPHLNVPVYSYNLCRRACRARLALDLCGCVPHLYGPMVDAAGARLPTCNVEGIGCILGYLNFIASLTKPTRGEKIECNCLANCNQVSFVVDSDTNQPWFLGTDLKWGLSRHPRMRLKRDLIFGVTDLLVHVGSTAGLFLGCSVLSVIELLYFLTLRLYWYTRTPTFSGARTADRSVGLLMLLRKP